MTSGQVINKRNGYALSLIIAILLISMIGIAVGSIAKGEERNLEKVTYPTSFKLSQSDTAYSFSELTYIMKDKDKQHYFVMEPEYYYYHWAEIIMTINYPEREDPLVYWDNKSWFSYQQNYIHIYEDSNLTKKMNIDGSEFTEFRYNFDENYSYIYFKLGEILDLLDENGGSQSYYIVIEPYMTATTEHEGSRIVIEFKYKDTEFTTTRKSHSTTTDKSEPIFTLVDSDERDPVSSGIHVYQPSKVRYSTTSIRTTTSTTRTTYRTITTQTSTVTTTKSTTQSTTRSTTKSAQTAKFADGQLESRFTGIASDGSAEWYVENGVVNYNFSGKVVFEGNTYDIEDGKVVNKTIRSTTNNNSKPASTDGEPETQKSGSETKDSSTTTKKNEPKPAATLNGLVQGPDGKWAMYKNGAVDKSATGIFQNKYGWWRVEKGYVNFNAQGIYQNAYGWWKTTNGKVTFKETGVFQNQFGWWRVKDSKVDFNANGIYQNKYGWWKTKNGKVDFSFTGIAKNEYGTWYVKGGKVDFSKNGNVTYNGKTYTVSNGKVK